MNAWRQLLLQVVLRHRVQRKMWITWTLLAALLLPLAGLASGRLPPTVAGMFAGVLASCLVLLWWGLFLQTAIRLNTPAAACLVPGMRRRLLALAAVLWIAGSLVPAALFGAASGHAGYALLLCAGTLLYIALCCRYPLLGFVPSLVWLATRLPWYPGRMLDAAVTAAGETAVTLAGLTVLAVLSAATLHALLPRGGDAHYRMGACLARQARARKGGMTPATGAGLFRLLDSAYYARLALPGHSATRLLDALGGRAHWGRSVAIIAALTVTALAWRTQADPETMRPAVPLLLVSMLVTVVTHVDGLLSAVKNSRVEQGILRLTPVAPPTRGFNRQLALALLGRFGIVLGAYLAGSGILVLATAGSWRAWLCCTALALAFTPLLLRDHARHPGWSTAQWTVGILMLVMAPLAGMAEYGAIAPALVAACSIVLLAGTAIALVLRWRGALAAAPAFPAGRLAV